MATRQYNILIRNLENTDDFAQTIPGLINVLPDCVTDFNFKIFDELLTDLVVWFVQEFTRRISNEKIQEERIKDKLQKILERLKKNCKTRCVRRIKEIKHHRLISSKIELSRKSCIVLLVSFFEAYLRDSFVFMINKKPKLGLCFLERVLKLEELKEYNFNVSRRLGDIIANRINFQDIKETQKNYKTAFKKDIFCDDKLLERKMRRLFQIRHVIIHNNAKIDRKYLSITKCKKNQLGKVIKVAYKDIKEFKNAVLRVANNIERMFHNNPMQRTLTRH